MMTGNTAIHIASQLQSGAPRKAAFLVAVLLFHVVATVLERTMARATIAYLEQRYMALEKEIADALRQSPTDDLAIADLEYRTV